MLTRELFALLEQTGDAAYCVTPEGEIRSWNAAAERLFGHRAADVIGRDVDAVLAARDALGTDALAGGLDAATRQWKPGAVGIPSFDLEVRTADGRTIWVNVSTIVADDPRTGHRLFVRLARDVTALRARLELLSRAVEIGRELASLDPGPGSHAPVEPLSEQERRILERLAAGQSAAAIAAGMDLAPQTLRNHLHRINRKLRTHSRLEAVTHALQRGLIEPPPSS